MENKQEIDSKMDKKIIFLDVDDHLVTSEKWVLVLEYQIFCAH